MSKKINTKIVEITWERINHTSLTVEEWSSKEPTYDGLFKLFITGCNDTKWLAYVSGAGKEYIGVYSKKEEAESTLLTWYKNYNFRISCKPDEEE